MKENQLDIYAEKQRSRK